MELLRRASQFCSDHDELKTIYCSFIRSILEYSSNVWHTSLTQENIDDIERIQKCALKIILKKKYIDYESSLQRLDMESLQERRDILLNKFTQNNFKN